jgi:hypothetical protein
MLAMRNLNRVAEAGTCPLGQVGRQASIFGGMVMALHPPLKRARKIPRASRLFLLWRAPSRRSRAPWASGTKTAQKNRTLTTDPSQAQDKRVGHPKKQRQIARRWPAWRYAGELSGDTRKEDCRESPKATREVGIPSSVAMNNLGPGPKANRPEVQRKRHDSSASYDGAP